MESHNRRSVRYAGKKTTREEASYECEWGFHPVVEGKLVQHSRIPGAGNAFDECRWFRMSDRIFFRRARTISFKAHADLPYGTFDRLRLGSGRRRRFYGEDRFGNTAIRLSAVQGARNSNAERTPADPSERRQLGPS